MREPEYTATIIKMDGTKLHTKDFNIFIKKISIPSAYIEQETETMPGSSRQTPMGGNIVRDPIIMDFEFRAVDLGDYSLLRNKVFKLFFSKEPFYFIDHMEKGKKWLVQAESFRPDEVMHRGKSSISLVPLNAYAQSIGTSLDPYTFTSELWSYGMGLLADASAQDYIHNSTTFQIYNPSNVAIDPREHELEIRLIHAGANSPGVTITNNTTGDVWSYTGSVTSGTTLVIDGVVSKKNTVNVVGDTNFGLITLAEGMNNFTITRLSGYFEIRFKFPFLYV